MIVLSSPSAYDQGNATMLDGGNAMSLPQQSRSFARMSVAFKRVLLLMLVHASLALSAFATCTAPKNPIEAENCLPGTPSSQWYIQVPASSKIQAFTTAIIP